MSEQPSIKAAEHTKTGICRLAPERPRQDVGICRACVEEGLFDAWFVQERWTAPRKDPA